MSVLRQLTRQKKKPVRKQELKAKAKVSFLNHTKSGMLMCRPGQGCTCQARDDVSQAIFSLLARLVRPEQRLVWLEKTTCSRGRDSNKEEVTHWRH